MSSGSSDQDRSARFREIYLQNYLPILGYALRRTSTRDEAADVVSETFLVLWRRLDSAPGAEETRPWLYGVAQKVIANSHRSERRRVRLTARLKGEPGTQQGVEADAAAGVVATAMQQLSPSDREVLRLAAWEELTPVELATAVGCSTSAAKTRLHRARRRLEHKLDLLGIGVHPYAQAGHVTTEMPVATGEEDGSR